MAKMKMRKYLGADVHDEGVDHGDVVAHARLLRGQAAVLQEGEGDGIEEKEEKVEKVND